MKPITFLPVKNVNRGTFFAYEATDVCKSLSFDSNKVKCVKILSEGQLQNEAAGVCKTLSFDSSKIEYLQTSLNKFYTRGEADVCLGASFDSSKIECMRNAGRSYEVPSQQELSAEEKLKEINVLARKIKSQLENGFYSRAMYNLVRLIDLASAGNSNY